MTTSSRLALAAAILVAMPAAAQADPKFGVRLGYYTKVEDVGLNLLAGIGARRGRVIPYAQAKVILKSDSEFVIGVGLRF